MQSISVFQDKAKFTDFWCKNADVSRTQDVCHIIHIFLGLLQVRYNCPVSSLSDMYETFQGRWPFYPSPQPSAARKSHISNKVTMFFHQITTIFAFFIYTINKINNIHILIYSHNYKQHIFILVRMKIFWILLSIIFRHENIFKICIDHNQ